MEYKIKEIFLSIHGEGANSGRTAVFCRFAGCNLWNGQLEDKQFAICKFCDTDFSERSGSAQRYTNPRDIVDIALSLWPKNYVNNIRPFVVLTGGEPLLQVDSALLAEFHAAGFFVAVETNGTIVPPPGIDWLTVSPKAGTNLKITKGDELKLVFPQVGVEPEKYEHLAFKYFFLQPMDGPDIEANTRLAVMFCMEHPKWRLSLQIHKFLNIP